MTDDFYCDEVLSGRTAVEVVAETEAVLAFHHSRPFWPVHIVVIPKMHVPSLTDLAGHTSVLEPLLDMVREVAARSRPSTERVVSSRISVPTRTPSTFIFTSTAENSCADGLRQSVLPVRTSAAPAQRARSAVEPAVGGTV